MIDLLTTALKHDVKFLVMTEKGIFAAVPKNPEENSAESVAAQLVEEKGITEFAVLEIKGVYTEQKSVRNLMEEAQ